MTVERRAQADSLKIAKAEEIIDLKRRVAERVRAASR
jgi:hypothetical protein